MSLKKNFFINRRSVVAAKMLQDPIKQDDLNTIINAGIRVPDHGGLNPWKIIVIQGETLKKIDKDIIFPEFIKNNPDSNENIKKLESSRLQRASVVIAVLSKPKNNTKIPTWEMILSSGAVCMNLLSCAQSMGYAAQWLTEWYAYNNKLLSYLGGEVGTDKISGFIYIGHKQEEPKERKRPNPSDVINFIK
jgi:nitroreductase